MNKNLQQIIDFFRRYLTLCLVMIVMNLRKERRSYIAGMAWWIIEPLFFCIIFYVFFVEILGTHTPDFLPILVVCLVTWRWFSLSIVGGMGAITTGRGLIRNHDIPKALFPLQKILFESIRYSIGIVAVLFILSFFYDLAWPRVLLFVPYILFSCFFLLGISFVFSVVTVFIPDLRKAMPLIMRGLLLLSGVFFDASRLPEEWHVIYYANPFAVLMETLRAVIFGSDFPPIGSLFYLLACGVIVMAVGLYMQWRFNRIIPRYLL